MEKKNKRIIYFAVGIGLILLIPFVLTLINPNATINRSQGGGWDWTLSDFVIAGVFLFGSSLVYELISRRSNNVVYKAGVGVAVATALLLVWVNGAVGIIGNEDNPANSLYGGVLLIGVIGASIARLKPKGMAIALYITTFAQVLVPVVTYIFWPPSIASWSPGVPKVFVLNGFFATLFVVSASLFLRASEEK